MCPIKCHQMFLKVCFKSLAKQVRNIVCSPANPSFAHLSHTYLSLSSWITYPLCACVYRVWVGIRISDIPPAIVPLGVCIYRHIYLIWCSFSCQCPLYLSLGLLPHLKWKASYGNSPLVSMWLFSGKKRKPAWTDRILWRLKSDDSSTQDEGKDNEAGGSEKAQQQASAPGEEDENYPLKVKQDLYTSSMEYGVSDHKPVVGIFQLEVRQLYTLTLYIDWLTDWFIQISSPLSSNEEVVQTSVNMLRPGLPLMCH